jgi:hypothetical protein
MNGGTIAMTVCVNCRWHINAHEGRRTGPPASAWFYQLCGHPDVERPTTVDPVSGEVRHMARNDLGRTYLTDKARPYCRDINDGECSMYEPVGSIIDGIRALREAGGDAWDKIDDPEAYLGRDRDD